jgi:hypothetical protein
MEDVHKRAQVRMHHTLNSLSAMDGRDRPLKN